MRGCKYWFTIFWRTVNVLKTLVYGDIREFLYLFGQRRKSSCPGSWNRKTFSSMGWDDVHTVCEAAAQALKIMSSAGSKNCLSFPFEMQSRLILKRLQKLAIWLSKTLLFYGGLFPMNTYLFRNLSRKEALISYMRGSSLLTYSLSITPRQTLTHLSTENYRKMFFLPQNNH